MGFSGGARMSSRLGCNLSKQIASIGPVAGVRYPQDCGPLRVVSIITFHGKRDRVNHYTVNENSPPYWRMGVETAINGWINNNHCNQEADSSLLEGQVTRLSYAQCHDGADVVFYQSAIAGHSWPGSKIYGTGNTDKNIPATQLIWAFFKTHPLQLSRRSDDD
jgi:polyhydroxybutyrate depolymerase